MLLIRSFFLTHRLLVASIVALCGVVLAAAALAKDDDDSAAQPTEDAAASAKDNAAADSADELLKKLADAERDLKVVIRDIQRGAKGEGEQKELKLDDEQRKDLAEAVALIKKTADSLVGSKTATESQIERAQLIVARTLNTAGDLAGEEYTKQFDAYTDQLVKEFPKSAATEFSVAQRFYRKNLSGDPQPEALDELVKFAEEFPDNGNVGVLFRLLGLRLSERGQNDKAIATYEKGIELLGETRAAEMLKGPLRSLSMVGKPMEVKGPTPDNHHIDLAELKGKVVLVDFWGTWCGPCVGEIPNIKAVYDKYHDAGFEVIGVNVGDDKDTLKKFLEENQVRWQQIQYVDEKGKAQTNKVADQYEIHSFPSTFLIGRDGNVVAVDVRGDSLEKQVEKHIKPAAGS
jgi:thiol-disulfide isomerase/thioredoxin